MAEPIREARTSGEDRADLEFTEEEKRAMSGEADAEANVEKPVLSADDTGDGEVLPGAGAEGDDGEGAAAAGEQDDPSAFIDTRARKESYTPEEWTKLVKQRDFFQNEAKRRGVQIETVSQRVERIAGALEQQNQEPPEPAPDRQDDPTGYIDHQIEGVSEKVDKVAERIDLAQQRREAGDRQQAFVQASSRATEVYTTDTKQDPALFNGKLVALRESRYEDFIDEGYGEEEAYNLLIGWENKLIDASFQRGENPAAVMDRWFKRRGLTVKEATQEGQPDPTPGNQQNDGPRTEEVIKRAQQGVRTKTPSDESVPRGKSFKVTYDVLASMPPEEFEEVMGQIEGTSREDELDATGSTSVVLK